MWAPGLGASFMVLLGHLTWGRLGVLGRGKSSSPLDIAADVLGNDVLVNVTQTLVPLLLVLLLTKDFPVCTFACRALLRHILL